MKLLMISLFGLLVFNAEAQTATQKIGHADWEFIFNKMPEFKQIEAELKTYETQLQSQLKTKGQELETKYKSYQELPATTLEAIRKDKETELTNLQENLQKFQQDAQVSMQKKQNDLVAPVFAKIGKAIEEVAKENAYTYVINRKMIGGGDVLFFSDEKYNISNLVLKKLGITVADSTPTPPVKQN